MHVVQEKMMDEQKQELSVLAAQSDLTFVPKSERCERIFKNFTM